MGPERDITCYLQDELVALVGGSVTGIVEPVSIVALLSVVSWAKVAPRPHRGQVNMAEPDPSPRRRVKPYGFDL